MSDEVIVMVAAVCLAAGLSLGVAHGVRVAECQQAGYGAPSWFSGACTVWLEPIK